MVAPIALVTGGTSGIGRALAHALAATGATTVIVARDQVRGEKAAAEISAATGNEMVRLFLGDLSDLGSVRRLATDVRDTYPKLDVLIHCAAVYTRQRTTTHDGFETMFATNVLGPFLLTNLLIDALRAGSARVLVLSAPSTVKLDFGDLQAERKFRSLSAFGATKSADLLFTFELARRLDGTSVTANAVHPGLARTNLMRQAALPLRWATRVISAPPEKTAAAIMPLAVGADYEGKTGLFFRAGRVMEPPPYSRDRDVARRLWRVCSDLTGLEAQD